MTKRKRKQRVPIIQRKKKPKPNDEPNRWYTLELLGTSLHQVLTTNRGKLYSCSQVRDIEPSLCNSDLKLVIYSSWEQLCIQMNDNKVWFPLQGLGELTYENLFSKLDDPRSVLANVISIIMDNKPFHSSIRKSMVMNDWYFASEHKSLVSVDHKGNEIPLQNMQAKNKLEQMVMAYFMSKDKKDALHKFQKQLKSFLETMFPNLIVPDIQNVILEYISPTDYLDFYLNDSQRPPKPCG